VKSPKQFRPKSSPKRVTLEGGITISTPMASGRKTPTSKTPAKIYNTCCRGVGSAGI
jgi:hypothetical protein